MQTWQLCLMDSVGGALPYSRTRHCVIACPWLLARQHADAASQAAESWRGTPNLPLLQQIASTRRPRLASNLTYQARLSDARRLLGVRAICMRLASRLRPTESEEDFEDHLGMIRVDEEESLKKLLHWNTGTVCDRPLLVTASARLQSKSTG